MTRKCKKIKMFFGDFYRPFEGSNAVTQGIVIVNVAKEDRVHIGRIRNVRCLGLPLSTGKYTLSAEHKENSQT